MSYYTKNSKEKPTAHAEMDSVIEFVARNPHCVVTKERARYWVHGAKFVEYGDAVFDDPSLCAEQSLRDQVLLTTEACTQFQISERLGIVAAEAVMGVDLLKEIAIGWRDDLGGRSKTFEAEFRAAREAVLTDIKNQAHARMADAVVGISFSYASLGHGERSMVLVAATGTAIKITPS
jgi:uncharacterized protein YbjQ (UPF0145 family)